MSKIDDVIIDAHNAAPMGYGIWATEIKSWLMESKDHIASWVTEKDADVYRRNHLVSSKENFHIDDSRKPIALFRRFRLSLDGVC